MKNAAPKSMRFPGKSGARSPNSGQKLRLSGAFFGKTSSLRQAASRTELLQRMQANQCEICGREVDVEVHHIRKISDLKRKWQGRKSKPVWVKQMIARNRKTLVVCRKCHSDIHGGRYDGPSLTKL